MQSKIDAVKKALEENNPARIKSAHDELTAHMQKIGEAMQQAQASQPNAAGPGGHTGPKESSGKPDIEEAEVEILDDEDKKS